MDISLSRSHVAGILDRTPPRRPVSRKPITALSASQPAIADHGVRSAIDAIMSAYPDRGITRFFAADQVYGAARALADCRRVTIATGHNVGLHLPETDGVVGAVILARALAREQKTITLVSGDEQNHHLLSALLAYLHDSDLRDRSWIRRVSSVIFAPGHDHTLRSHAAQQFLKRERPEAVVAIELPGRNRAGERLNMRGAAIDRQAEGSIINQPVDELLLHATRRRLVTVGIGDGGNEAGLASIAPRVPLAQNEKQMSTIVPADHVITAWNSNLGATILAAAVHDLHGSIDASIDGETFAQLIVTSLQNGAVDGCTRNNVVGAAGDIDSEHRTGVDGFHPQNHRVTIDAVNALLDRKITPKQNAAPKLYWQGKPTVCSPLVTTPRVEKDAFLIHVEPSLRSGPNADVLFNKALATMDIHPAPAGLNLLRQCGIVISADSHVPNISRRYREQFADDPRLIVSLADRSYVQPKKDLRMIAATVKALLGTQN